MERGSYLMLEPGMMVRSQDGDDIGTIAEVVADEGLDIFRGIVVDTGSILEHDVFVPEADVASVDGAIVTLGIDHAAVRRLAPVDPAKPGQNRGMDYTPPGVER